ncbi:septal ring lytic transglycosylase RlpA family protein [Methylocaldum szegediense]|uniref:Endolytic peptidoglycan transglycosylase RlpA n=1 Tax=Methylocaldum szegediense TaxID=73780 RepID=A0ABM9HW91_9GAMM|nr:septal ring lytic transglycosylase RlpA family protein [Methylocaldum szegediense]CAI8728422.1 Endolytic peptidoglycan transglycosylase RlpA [Methylocaldum szegediense]
MRSFRLVANSLLSIYLASSCTVGHARTASSKNLSSVQKGIASYYSDRFHGRRTASGERYDRNGLTAMHRSLPFGTRIRVTNLSNNRSVEVRVNDRGAPTNKRLLDLSRRAAQKLGFIKQGLAQVKLEVIQPGDG